MVGRMNSWTNYYASAWHWDMYDCVFPEKQGLGDVDGIMEKKGNILIVETKSICAPIKTGQRLLLRNLHAQGCTVLVLFGEVNNPKRALWLIPDDNTAHSAVNIDNDWLKDFLKQWYLWASENPRKNSISFNQLFNFGGEL